MTGILFLTEAIYCNIFRYSYLQNEKSFPQFFFFFFFAFYKVRFSLKHFQKNDDPLADLFLNLQSPKKVVR